MTDKIDLPRRSFLLAAPFGLIAACSGAGQNNRAYAEAIAGEFADSEWRKLTPEEWQARLSPLAYRVLREEATERAFTSPLNEEKRNGVFHCAGCDLAIFESQTKYDSGTGWPSFYDYIPGTLGFKEDNKLWMTRTEYHCARCDGHHGHVFKDGPAPTGLRYCNNGVALTFKLA
ncbi:MAG: peptide-methionine (R)-S-oxide reductase MsrB [Pseudomonadota bacterium]